MYGIPEKDGEENSYHLYYDYADMSVHLEINGKEVELPPKLRKELEHVFELYFAIVDLVGRLVAHADRLSRINAWSTVLELDNFRLDDEE